MHCFIIIKFWRFHQAHVITACHQGPEQYCSSEEIAVRCGVSIKISNVLLILLKE